MRTFSNFILNSPNPSFDADDLLYGLWLLDSLEPGAKPLVVKTFETKPQADVWEALADDGFRLIMDFQEHRVYLNDVKQLVVSNPNAYSAIYVGGRDKADVAALYDTLKKKYGQASIPTNNLKLLVSSNTGYKLTNLSAPAEPLQTGNYSPQVLQKFKHLTKQLVADRPRGRIGVLSGYPGTGKTYLLRAILNEYVEDVDFVLINIEQCLQVSQNLHRFMQMLATRPESGYARRKVVLLLEDADSAIAPRSANNLSAIQAILNFGDGLMGDALDVRLLVTTNVRTVEIDPAILRKGRLIAHIEVGALDPAQANAAYHRISGGKEGSYKQATTIAQVYDDVGKLEEVQAAE